MCNLISRFIIFSCMNFYGKFNFLYELSRNFQKQSFWFSISSTGNGIFGFMQMLLISPGRCSFATWLDSIIFFDKFHQQMILFHRDELVLDDFVAHFFNTFTVGILASIDKPFEKENEIFVERLIILRFYHRSHFNVETFVVPRVFLEQFKAWWWLTRWGKFQ